MENKKTTLRNTLRGFGIFCLAYIGYKLVSPVFYMNDRPKMYSQTNTIKTDTINTTFNITNLLVGDADSANRNPSAWSDSMIIFQNAVVTSKKTIQYNLALKIDRNKYNIPKVKRLMEKNLLDSFINLPAFKVAKDSNVTIVFNFTDIKMKPLFKIALTPDKYK